ncbi:MAG: membrane protein insertase YidC [Bdellovibrionales bacterium]
MRKSRNANFLDSKTILAMVIVFGIFIAWQSYMRQKYPDAFAPKKAETTDAATEPTKGEATAKLENQKSETVGSPSTPPEASAKTHDLPPEKRLNYDSDLLAFQISSHGMGLRQIQIKKFTDRENNVIEIGHPEPNLLPLETRLLGRAEVLNFDVQKLGDNHFVGHAKVGGVEITKTLEIEPDKYLLRFKVTATGNDPAFIGLTTAMTDKVLPAGEHSFLMPQFEKQEFYLDSPDMHEREVFAPDKDVQHSWSRARVVALGSQYFTQALVDSSPVMPDVKGRVVHEQKLADLMLQYTVLNRGEPFQLEYKAFLGPKSYALLSQIDPQLARVVDFGFFEWIGKHILLMLKWFYALVGNWGLAVILLTLVVRLLVLPINVYSYKSMKAMQAIQPQLKALKEKYADDQQKQQQETMALMRENKVNPLGGCLPVFLQFPIFIALYQVLGNSIELYQAPFGLWIHDLSLKDPFYVLPVLMGATMFVQQKITPTTMDPAQAKVMLMMPLIFTFFMVSLPSGLTLYMWVGALFSILQQMYFMRDKKPLSTNGV